MSLKNSRCLSRSVLPAAVAGMAFLAFGAKAEPAEQRTPAEWPQYRADARRSGFVDDEFGGALAAEWVYQPRQAPSRAWLGEDTRMSFDQACHPLVVSDGMVFLASSAECSIVALDVKTAGERWRYVTDAPVRFAPAVWQGRVFAVSDDGSLYVLDAATGGLIRRVDPAPRKDMVLGNRRMVSRWPARGGPVICDGVVYFGAGIWPSEGVILSALDAATGELIWRNDESGGLEWDQPHGGARAESGIAAQGYLAATAENLLVPTGRGVPAAFDRRNGQMKYFHLQKYGRPTGGATVVAAGEFFFNGGHFFSEATGLSAGRIMQRDLIVATPGKILYSDGGKIHAIGWTESTAVDRRGDAAAAREFHPLSLGAGGEDRSVAAPHEVHAMIAVGNTLVLGGPDVATAIDLQAASPERVIAWQAPVEGMAGGLAWAAGRLFVSTDLGTIYCFGPGDGNEPRTVAPDIAAQPWDDNRQYAAAAEEIVQLGGVHDGYALDLGCGEGRLAYELATRTKLHVIAVESDPNAVAAARERLIAAGLYGTRVTVHQGDPARTVYPNYFADLVVSARSLSEGPDAVAGDEMMRLLRPWGGVAVVGKAQAMRRVERDELPDTGTWTHQYCDAQATLTSADQLVRRPLGMLWFTDFEHLRMPDRHGRGPAPLFTGGRLFVLGKHGLYALNAYNGRLLWEHPIENALTPYDQEHITGAAVTGSPYCYGQGSVYVRHENEALRIDEATGEALARFSTPASPDSAPGTWGFIATDNGVLFGSVANDEHVTMWAWHEADMEDMPSESTGLFGLDAVTGEHLWTYKASHSIRHNTIVAGGGRVYFIDRPLAQDDLLARQVRREDNRHHLVLAGEPAGHPYGVLVVLDARSGEVLWKANDEVFGTMLALSLEHDVLVMTYQRSHAYFLRSEVGGRMAGYRASTGERIWSVEADHKSRIMLNGDTIYAQAGAWKLRTGEPVPFQFARSYGCGTLAASRHMMLFRSATLGYRDFSTDRTENYGGIRPGCWINAIPAGGLVLMPDATHGCTCSYLNKAYIALQPME